MLCKNTETITAYEKFHFDGSPQDLKLPVMVIIVTYKVPQNAQNEYQQTSHGDSKADMDGIGADTFDGMFCIHYKIGARYFPIAPQA